VKPPFRTKTLGTKVSEEEFAQLEARASARGLTLSEWCRETLLASVNGQGEKSAELSLASGTAFDAPAFMCDTSQSKMPHAGKRPHDIFQRDW